MDEWFLFCARKGIHSYIYAFVPYKFQCKYYIKTALKMLCVSLETGLNVYHLSRDRRKKIVVYAVRTVKVQVGLRICAVPPEPSLFLHAKKVSEEISDIELEIVIQ